MKLVIFEFMLERLEEFESGADTQNRTGDLILTKDALYRLSYISISSNFGAGSGNRTRIISLEG